MDTYITLEAFELVDESEKAYLIDFGTQILWVPKKITYGGFSFNDFDITVKEWWVKKNNLEGVPFFSYEDQTNQKRDY